MRDPWNRRAGDATNTENININTNNISTLGIIISFVMVTLIMRLMTSTKTVETATTGVIEIPKVMTGEC